jgi:hypothetical protein
MKAILLAMGAVTGLTLLALAPITLVVFHDHSRLSQDHQALVVALQAANARIHLLETEKAAMTRHLAERSSDSPAAQSQPVPASTTASTNHPTQTAAPRPYQVQTYLGKQYLGLAWLVPRHITTDPKTGHVVYQPVLVLNPGLRRAFTETTTNVVREMVPTPSAGNSYHYYYPVQYPWTWWVPSAEATRETIPSPARPRHSAATRPSRLQPSGATAALRAQGPWRPVPLQPRSDNGRTRAAGANAGSIAARGDVLASTWPASSNR